MPVSLHFHSISFSQTSALQTFLTQSHNQFICALYISHHSFTVATRSQCFNCTSFCLGHRDTGEQLKWPDRFFRDNWIVGIYNLMHLSMSSPKGGGGSGIGWRFWHFLKKIIKIPTPRQRIHVIVKIGRNKWFTSHLLFKIDRSNTWCQVKIPTLGICITVKFPWVAHIRPGTLVYTSFGCSEL